MRLSDTRFIKEHVEKICTVHTEEYRAAIRTVIVITCVLAKIKAQKEIHTLVSEFLDSLLSEQGNRLIVFVDELDRCKPEYAVRLLERIKHYFSNDRITFVFSVNIDELQHTVKSYYGDGFDACRYFDRFFDQRVALPPANMNNYFQEIGLFRPSRYVDKVCKSVIDYCGLGIREINKYYLRAKMAVYKPTHAFHHAISPEETTIQLSLMLIVPIIIGLHMTNVELYNDFITGKNPKPLLDIMAIVGEQDVEKAFCTYLLENDETLDITIGENKKNTSIQKKLELAYYALFDDRNRDPFEDRRIGKCVFNERTKEEVLLATGILSSFLSFE